MYTCNCIVKWGKKKPHETSENGRYQFSYCLSRRYPML